MGFLIGDHGAAMHSLGWFSCLQPEQSRWGNLSTTKQLHFHHLPLKITLCSTCRSIPFRDIASVLANGDPTEREATATNLQRRREL
jgi:hypothetical protein